MKEFINKRLEVAASSVNVFRTDVGADLEKFFVLLNKSNELLQQLLSFFFYVIELNTLR